MGIKEVLRKSVLRNTIISLTKARPTKYYRREKVKGKWRYYYTKEQYRKEKGDKKNIEELKSKRQDVQWRINKQILTSRTEEEVQQMSEKLVPLQNRLDKLNKEIKRAETGKVTSISSVQQGKVSVSTKDKKPVTSAAGGGARKGGNGKDSEFEKKMKDMKDSPKGKFGESLAGLESAYKRLSEKDKKSPKGIEFKKEIEAVRRGKDLTKESK